MLDKHYNPGEFEKKWYEYWEKNGFMNADINPDKKPFTIVIPPPNVTAQLHIGQALDFTLQDIVIRFKRMQGYEALWLPGEDHAGIATQYVVEKKIVSEGKSKEKLGREEFIKVVWEWVKEYRQRIREQLKAIGSSCDWRRERFTLDEGLSKAVTKVFVELYKKGLVYRGDYIVNWCPRCGTVLSNDEVEYEDVKGNLYYIRYPIKDSNDHVVIATTRPETMLADTGVAFHPSDERYKRYEGKSAILPLVGRELPIFSDKYVDPSFGTGALKVTPGHDPNDFLLGQRHGLKTINLLDPNGRINENGGEFKGLTIKEAREKVIEALKSRGYLLDVKEYVHSVGHCYRCHTEIEPIVSKQWFVKMKPLAEKAMKVVREGKIKFYPSRWEKVYFNWLENIRDWCISRQLWWGHRIPAWYCKDCGHITVSEDKVQRCEKCGSTNIYQDEDVLDTWFSSALWPFSTLGWPEKTPELEYFYPTSLLVTGFDILFFWVARMIMQGLEFMDEIPFGDVYLHQLVLDRYGRKMSKSLGNGIDPLDVINKYGTDALRFTFASLAAQGRDIIMDEKRIVDNKFFANKIWNSARFTLMNTKDMDRTFVPEEDELELADKWILSRLQRTISTVTLNLDRYEFSNAAKALYQFIWSEFCDWYIECSKIRLYGKDKGKKRVAQYVLFNSLEIILRLLHPFMPFITEEIWQNFDMPIESVMIAKWPSADPSFINEGIEEKMQRVINVIKTIRNIKSELNIPLKVKVDAVLNLKNDTIASLLNSKVEMISALAGVVLRDSSEEDSRAKASGIVDNEIEVSVLLEEGTNLEYERNRLNKKLTKLRSDIGHFEKQLENERFIRSAPEDVVDDARKKLKNYEIQYEKVKYMLESMQK